MPRLLYERGRFPNGAAPRQRIFVATPVTDGKICDNYVYQLANSAIALADAGVAMDTCIESYNCHVDDARNGLVRQFMETDCTDLVFIDGDVGWEVNDLVKLVGYDRDIVAGIYPKKSETESWPVYTLPGELRGEADGLLQVARVPTGFLRIRRCVFERLMEQLDDRKFYSDNAPAPAPPYYLIYERSYKDQRRWSGDYEFCNKAADAGFKIYIDPEMVFSHSGGEKVWRGCLGDYWRRINGIAHPDFDAAVAAIRKGPATAEHLTALMRHWGNPWAASPLLLGALHEAVRCMPPDKAVLEAGSGLSTLVMAAAAEQSGVKVYALEHDIVWADKTRALLDRYNLTHPEVIYAPLDDYSTLAGDRFPELASRKRAYWYNVPPWAVSVIENTAFGLVMIDGPPRDYQARDNIHEILGTQIHAAHWFMDDADDLDERAQFAARAQAAGREIEVLGKPGGRQFAIAAAPKGL